VTPGAAPSLTEGRLRPVILRLALPAVGMMACHFTFNLIDTIWVGRLMGPTALAAVSTGGFLVWVVLSLGEMMDVGLIAVAARRHGQGLPDHAAQAAAGAVIAAVGVGTVTAVVGFQLIDPLFAVMRVPAEVAVLGRQYLATWLLGTPLVFGFFALEAAFRASGDTRTPFTILAASVALGAVLDPLLITGAGPLPAEGVRGAAAASIAVRGLAFVLLLGIAVRRRRLLRFGEPDWAAVPTILKVGAPMSLSGVLLSLIYVWLTRYTAQFGTPALAALGIGHKMEGLGFIAISGFALSAGALVGQNLGAGNPERARKAVRLTIKYCLAVTLTTAIAFLTIPAVLVRLFTSDPMVVADGVLYLRIISIAQIGQSFELILEAAMAGAAYTFWPMAVSGTLTGLRIPLAAWWSGLVGVVGIWWALSLTAAGRGVAMAAFWRWAGWQRTRGSL
jgi:putative MATE family efflux protein